jgi:hypothetical protein
MSGYFTCRLQTSHCQQAVSVQTTIFASDHWMNEEEEEQVFGQVGWGG